MIHPGWLIKIIWIDLDYNASTQWNGLSASYLDLGAWRQCMIMLCAAYSGRYNVNHQAFHTVDK